MDNRQFDAFTRTLTTSNSPRRAILQGLGATALAAVAGRFAGEAGEARKKRKKKKKCKGDTRKCNGRCIPADTCCEDADCGVQQVCANGICVPDPNEFCQANDDCGVGQECLAGACILVQGTCDVADDHCSVTEALCNPESGNDCFCLQRFGGGVACTEGFVTDATCGGCNSDADCDEIEPESVCVTATENGCPCEANLGICARLCTNL